MEDLQFQGPPIIRRLIAALLLLFASLIVSLCGSCSRESGKGDQTVIPAPAISTTELRQLVDSGEDIFLLDVRRDSEYIAERLSFTDLRITHDSLKAHLESLPPDKTTPIYCFCRGGVRSDHAARYLISIGYKNVLNVSRGMLAWKENGFETVSGPP
ncbi:MAG: rhodanese-like domain-containing protein [Candidatus Zixiibacteriota bacterium]|nr:MAG: rhodanese-like domain-containing protein [candidate division Zixibacteria bacterium]